MKRQLLLLCCALSFTAFAHPSFAAATLDHYLRLAPSPPSAERGKRLWRSEGVRQRRCTSCHGEDLRQPGRHQRTGKRIEPMAPSVNDRRYSDRKKMEKWFRRNCKWTWGRECTAQEKADILLWLNTL